jgi:hypothetical protein
MLVAQKDAITKITGIITPESIDTLKNKLGGAFTIVKSTHFVDGQRYGFLASMIPQEKYWIVISNPAWVYVAPANPGAYSAAALVVGVRVAQQEQLVAQHKEEQMTYANYLGTQEAGKELLLYSVGADVLAPLKKQYINFGDATIHSMILHLQEKTAINMTTSQKFEYKTEGYKMPWDPTMSITAYFTGLEKFKNSLADCGISMSFEEMTMAAGARMWESEMFTEDQLVLWENKPSANQTWQALQNYFMEKWLERRQYSQATTKQSRFKDAALATQEQVAAEEEGKALAIMFALLQEQHKMQLKAMATVNQKAMEAMFKRINAIVGGQCKVVDKENTPPAAGNTGKSTRGMKRNRKKCTHCGKHVFHKPSNCYELEANKSKRWMGWKTVKGRRRSISLTGTGDVKQCQTLCCR